MLNALKAFISGLSPKEKKILSLACAVIALTVIDRMVYSPLSRRAHDYDEKITTQTKLIQKNLLILRYKNKIMSEQDSYGGFYTKPGLAHEEMVASFLKEVENLAKDSNVTLTNINPVNMEEKKGYVQYSMTIECAGKMQNVIDLIFGVENAKKPVRVISFDISPKNREAYEVQCKFTIVKIIVMPQGQEQAEAQPPA